MPNEKLEFDSSLFFSKKFISSEKETRFQKFFQKTTEFYFLSVLKSLLFFSMSFLFLHIAITTGFLKLELLFDNINLPDQKLPPNY